MGIRFRGTEPAATAAETAAPDRENTPLLEVFSPVVSAGGCADLGLISLSTEITKAIIIAIGAARQRHDLLAADAAGPGCRPGPAAHSTVHR